MHSFHWSRCSGGSPRLCAEAHKPCASGPVPISSWPSAGSLTSKTVSVLGSGMNRCGTGQARVAAQAMQVLASEGLEAQHGYEGPLDPRQQRTFPGRREAALTESGPDVVSSVIIITLFYFIILFSAHSSL